MNHNFIAQYENVFTDEYCQKVINFYENASDAGLTLSRQNHDKTNKLSKEDSSVFVSNEDGFKLTSSKELIVEFGNLFWQCYAKYAAEYSILDKLDPHKIYHYKIQKTEVGQGYHVWHCESDRREYANRLLAWTLYLNDVEEGGETEFLYQHLRVKPKTGTLVIWPAGFTHVHRGNPPLSNTKYIVTGWVEF